MQIEREIKEAPIEIERVPTLPSRKRKIAPDPEKIIIPAPKN